MELRHLCVFFNKLDNLVSISDLMHVHWYHQDQALKSQDTGHKYGTRTENKKQYKKYRPQNSWIHLDGWAGEDVEDVSWCSTAHVWTRSPRLDRCPGHMMGRTLGWSLWAIFIIIIIIIYCCLEHLMGLTLSQSLDGRQKVALRRNDRGGIKVNTHFAQISDRTKESSCTIIDKRVRTCPLWFPKDNNFRQMCH